jgi:hypothetical protein
MQKMSDYYSFSPIDHLRLLMTQSSKKMISSTRFDGADIREKNRRDYIALCFAVTAAENKQPKPPIKRGKNYSCGSCYKGIDKTIKYCPNCGQCVKWGD